ncbi:MAG: hypothetical protein HRU18_01250 [Pseudoalteromonas sp.]|uniref:hypothetical protein n=1 Tax=Pseudoalteromonas sp. TaxID=53249 RepID=UPI001E14C5BF|nr:hypothetical protein [Pseudoalteromonas sp.]NRA76806.1 hypothetical protein [Pseudoalteromonas sp.]
MKTKDKLRKLAKLVGYDVKTVKQSIRTASMISGVSFAMALDSMLKAQEAKKNGSRLSMTTSAIQKK